MSRGSRSKRSGSIANGDGGSINRQVWIVAPAPPRESDAQRELRTKIRELAEAEGVSVVTRLVQRKVFEGGPDAHKSLNFLEPRDAGDLYSAIHRRYVLVVPVCACVVRTDPSEDPARVRHARKLEDFVQYKAAYGLLRGPGDPQRVFAEFMNKHPEQLCEGVHDPRVLPLHVFDNTTAWVDLHLDGGISRFDACYGRESLRVDSNGRRWRPATVAPHGSDALIVDGVPLPSGYHWDVQRGRSTDRLVTCHEVWKIDNRGYANVYPDAYVRVGKNYGRRVWPPTR